MTPAVSTATNGRPTETTVAEAARAIAVTQGMLADSPAEISEDGEVRLCLASCYAAAGLDALFGATERKNFERELARSADKGVVESAYALLGWDVIECRRKMQHNDRTPRGRRLETVFDIAQ